MRKDIREFIRRLEAAGLTVESTPGQVLRDDKPLRKANGMPFTLGCWCSRCPAESVVGGQLEEAARRAGP